MGNAMDPTITPSLPHTLGELEIINPFLERGYIYLNLINRKQGANDHDIRFNVQILDEVGQVLVRIKNLKFEVSGSHSAEVNSVHQNDHLGAVAPQFRIIAVSR